MTFSTKYSISWSIWTKQMQCSRKEYKKMVMYTYKCRPGYGSKDLMIEFENGTDNKSFMKDLAQALRPINGKISSSMDAWMNDEVWINITTKHGKFTLTKDSWGFVFIMTKKNQVGMMILDQLLAKNKLFEKIETDRADYE